MASALKTATDPVAIKWLFSVDDMCIVRKDLNLFTKYMLQLRQNLREIGEIER